MAAAILSTSMGLTRVNEVRFIASATILSFSVS